jgi:heme/copper-type cytochrome/quinol oxidase subunit 3
MYQRHPYHLVNASPWPLITSVSALMTALGAAMYMHGFKNGDLMLFSGLFMVIASMSIWWRDVIREATFEGHHTQTVQKGLRIGMILFIASEVMFFLAFFWAFFHSSLSPAVEIGDVWPPTSINTFDPWGVPLLNTLILLLSGATVTWAHHAIVAGQKEAAKMALLLTLLLAVSFTALQVFEYIEASFTISDGVYGSTFFMATGFHGFHVIVGTLFLTVCFVRQIRNHFTRAHHFGFEAAAWYWHFVGATVRVYRGLPRLSGFTL